MERTTRTSILLISRSIQHIFSKKTSKNNIAKSDLLALRRNYYKIFVAWLVTKELFFQHAVVFLAYIFTQ